MHRKVEISCDLHKEASLLRFGLESLRFLVPRASSVRVSWILFFFSIMFDARMEMARMRSDRKRSYAPRMHDRSGARDRFPFRVEIYFDVDKFRARTRTAQGRDCVTPLF